jgi:hypothetical protein
MTNRASPKKDKQPENKDNSQVKIAVITGIVAIITVMTTAIFGPAILKIMDRTAVPVTATTSNTPAPPLVPPGPTETQASTYIPTATSPVALEPTPLMIPNCIPSEIWTFFPRKAIPTDGCWFVDEFVPNDNEIQIGITTPQGAGEQQRGFYTRLDGNADIQFTLKIEKFETFGDNTFRPNIAFGIVEGSPFEYYNGIYLYYYASKPNIERYVYTIAQEQNVFYNGALDIQQEQIVKFSIRGKKLTVSIDDIGKNEFTLNFNKNAFYFGYHLPENTNLLVTISKFSITPQK